MGRRYICRAGKFGGARRIAPGKRHDLAAWVRPKCRQLDRASVVATDYPQTDHGVKAPQNTDFAMRGMDLS